MDDEGKFNNHYGNQNILWICAALLALFFYFYISGARASDTAVKQDPLQENQFRAMEIIKGWHMNPQTVGVYYIPPPSAEKRGFIFDDIPRDAIGPNHKQLTEERIAKQRSFVKFNARQISFSVMETEEDSVRVNYYPNKGALMLNWTIIIEPGKWWWFER